VFRGVRGTRGVYGGSLPRGDAPIERRALMLDAESIAVRFGPVHVLAGVDLTVSASEIVSIMGPSGSGKSTLLACLAGLIRPSAGRVMVNGRDLGAMSESERSRLRLQTFGFVFQFGDLVPELTIVENAELPLRFSGVGSRDARRRAYDSLELLGVGHIAGRRTFEVSGGELQRAAVARALVHSPLIVFADEPTGALDATNGRLVLDAFVHAAKCTESSVVIVTHDATVAAVAARHLRVEGGRLYPDPG
jgi:putative ABC transport system ATP-binding protein